MLKKLFLSCYSYELDVAVELKKNLEYAFKSNLEIESPLSDMKCGDDWKEYLKTRLSDCDGLISLISPSYVKSAWLVAEFVPFWLSEKTIFPVTIGFEDKSTDIFKLITDKYLIARLENPDDVEKLLDAIAEFYSAPKPELKYLNRIVNDCYREYNNTVARENESDSERYTFVQNRNVQRYIKNSTVWQCSLRKDSQGILSAVCQKELKFISVGNNIRYLEMPLRALDEEGITFNDIYVDASGRKATIGSIRKLEESVFKYRINFHPALKQGDIVEIKYKISIPQCKLATREKAFEFITNSDRIEIRQESITTTIDAPTDEFYFKIMITLESGVTPQEIQAKCNNIINTDELEFIRTNKCYSEIFKPEEDCIMELTRRKPKVGITYIFSWLLPNQDDVY
jgi:hypothetical protein